MFEAVCINEGHAWVVTLVGTPICTIEAFNAAVFYNKNGNVQESDPHLCDFGYAIEWSV